MKKKLVILFNETIFKKGENFFGESLDSKSISEGLSKNYDIEVIGRTSKIENPHKINLKNVNVSSNIFSYMIILLRNIFKKRKYLIVSISPSTFFGGLILMIFGKKPFLYLRSDGFEEYKKILGIFGIFLYQILFSILTLRCEIISCNSVILRGKKGSIVSPSQLSDRWFKNISKPSLSKISLLYVGRLRIEKGIFSLMEELNKINMNFELTIIPAGEYKNFKINNDNIKIKNINNINDSIINEYDQKNIFILPSFTEGHPQVLDEALARRRPVLIFEDIEHVIGNRKGVFVTKRNHILLKDKLNFILKNYDKIYESMKDNILPTKSEFINSLEKVIK